MLQKVELVAIASVLDQLDYYRLLKVPSHASDEEIRNAFHREALLLHPDQYHAVKDPEVQELSKKVYSKVIEAYRTLVNTQKRTEYDRLLKRASGKIKTGMASVDASNDTGGLEFDRSSGSSPRTAQVLDDTDEITAVRKKEKTTTTGAGVRFFKMAQASFQARDYKTAKMNIQIAMNTDATNPEFMDLAHRIDAELKKIQKK